MFLRILSTIILFVFSTKAYAEGIKTIRCTFDKEGIAASWDDGKNFDSERAKFSTNPADMVLTFDQINNITGRARLIGNNGSEEVIYLDTDGWHSFLEVTATGNPILTSVFKTALKDGKYPAVTSRHVSVVMPIVSQYYGSCVDQSY